MPALTAHNEAIRITKASKALSLMSQGMTQARACEEVGISQRQLRHWLGKEEEAIQSIRDMTIELERTNLANIIVARSLILQRISDVVATTPLPVKDLVLVDNHLKTIQDELEVKYGAQSQDADAEAFLLNGPNLESHESVFSARLTQTHTTLEIKGEKSQANTNDIIDAEFMEEEEGQ